MWKAVICVACFAVLSATVSAQQFVSINGHRMVALRDFSQDVGAVVGFDPSRNAISITLGYQTVEVIPYSTTAWINGNPVTIPNPVVILDDVTYLPFRFMCHGLNLNATWSNGNQQVIVVNPYTYQSIPFLLNVSFGQRSHITRRDYNIREYQNLPPPPARHGATSNPYGLRRPANTQRPQGRGQSQGGGTPRGATVQPQGGGTPRGGGRTIQPQGGGGSRGGTNTRGAGEEGGRQHGR